MRPRVVLFNLPPGGDHFPISLGYIAAFLKQKKTAVSILDLAATTPLSLQKIVSFLTSFKPHIAGISAYQVNMREVLAVARLVKSLDKRCVVIAGGPQATFMPAAALREMPDVDLLCRSEGEMVMWSLCRQVALGAGICRTQGVACRSGKRVSETEPPAVPGDLDEYPSPYSAGVFDFSGHRVATLLASRGCVFNCSFCYTPAAFGRTVRVHSAKRVMQDIDACVKKGVNNFFFADPSFTADASRVRELMHMIISRRLRIKIWCESRTDLVDLPTLRLMRKAGVFRIAYGLESADQAVLKAVKKDLDLKKFGETVRLTQKQGIEVEAFNVYGLPGQTYESALRTQEYLRSLGIRIKGNSGGQQLSLYFGTAIEQRPGDFGVRIARKKRPAFLSAGLEFETRAFKPRHFSLMQRRLAVNKAFEDDFDRIKVS